MRDFYFLQGDLVLQEGDLVLIEGDALLRQQIEQVLGTNLGEWEFDENEGIPFSELLTREWEEDRVADAIRSALLQVDESLELGEMEIRREGRTAGIYFTVKKQDGEQLEMRKDVDGARISKTNV